MKKHITFLAIFAAAISAVAAASIVGIGIVLKEKKPGEPAIVKQVVSGSPASGAGIKADLIILSIDGTNTITKSGSECASLIRGAPKTSVVLEVVDSSIPKTNTLTIQREKILIE